MADLDQQPKVAGVGLSLGQLKKYRWRVEKFVRKIWENQSLTTVDERTMIPTAITIDGTHFIPNSPDQITAIVDHITNLPPAKKVIVHGLVDDEPVAVSSSQIAKTAEFGGKPSGFETVVENMALADVKNQLSIAIANNDGQPINIVVGHEEFCKIVDVQSTPKTPKSDIDFIDVNGNSTIFVSHKGGREPYHFQQYSGVSKFYHHPEVVEFIDDIKQELGGDVLPPRTFFRRKVSDPDLAIRSIYGHDFGGGYGINNVNVLIQGDINLIQITKTVYQLSGSRIFYNGQIPHIEGYVPSLVVTYRSARMTGCLSNGRLGIYPYHFGGSKPGKDI